MASRYQVLTQQSVIKQICNFLNTLEENSELLDTKGYLTVEDEAYTLLQYDNIQSFYDGAKLNCERR